MVKLSTIALFERDVYKKDSQPPYVRGRYPPYCYLAQSSKGIIQSVSRSFRNLTTLTVPAVVQSFLSFGPKFMLPSFTLNCSEDKDDFWADILYQLEGAGYYTVQYRSEREELSAAYDEHVGDAYLVSRSSVRTLLAAYHTNSFLKKHIITTALVEGDKGKVFGLLPRHLFVKLCDDFISGGVSNGSYKEMFLASEVSFLEQVKVMYMEYISPLNRLQHNEKHQGSFLFVPACNHSSIALKEVHKLNSYVRGLLVRVNWKMPVFRPTVKFHKDPLKVRPVICKRNTPSISVGKVIRFAISKVMVYNEHLNESMNVIRVEDLMEELFGIYSGDPSFGFFSIDVVSMFDRIPMAGVINVVKLLDMRYNDGMVNVDWLVKLINLDRGMFDFFKYRSPTTTASKPRYFHQRVGIPMGGNTSNLYADLYMRHHISIVSHKLRALGVLFLRKYVDDFLVYAPKANFKRILNVLSESTHLEFTMELPVNGNLPYLDLRISDVGGRLTTSWYRKPITSDRLINYHSTVPSHELINTFVQRLVVCNRYDSGGSFLRSYYVILLEMLANCVPRRVMRLCLNRCKRYWLGRQASHKRQWLTLLASDVYGLPLRCDSFEVFEHSLQSKYSSSPGSAELFVFSDDTERACKFQNHQKRIFHVPGDPIIIIPYRGRQSEKLHKVLRRKYSACTTVYRHDRYYSSIQMFQKGLESTRALVRAGIGMCVSLL